MASMIFCLGCKTVVWADDVLSGDLRGFANEAQLICPECGAIANFDGFRAEAIEDQASREGGDLWGAMHNMARMMGLTWGISPDGAWFHRPDGENKTQDVRAAYLKIPR